MLQCTSIAPIQHAHIQALYWPGNIQLRMSNGVFFRQCWGGVTGTENKELSDSFYVTGYKKGPNTVSVTGLSYMSMVQSYKTRGQIQEGTDRRRRQEGTDKRTLTRGHRQGAHTREHRHEDVDEKAQTRGQTQEDTDKKIPTRRHAQEDTDRKAETRRQRQEGRDKRTQTRRH